MNLSKTLLKTLNLSSDEAAVYLASLELGQATIQTLSHKSGVKRTTIYHFINELVDRGMLQSTKKRKRLLYSGINPKQLVLLEQIRIKELENLIPELSAISNQSIHKPRVVFFEGIEGIKEALTDILATNKPMIGWADFSFRQSILGNFFDMFAKERARHEITYQAIARDTPEAREWQKKNIGHLRDFKFIKSEPFNTETLVYGDHVMFLSYQKKAFAVIIQDANISTTLRIAWEQLWNRI